MVRLESMTDICKYLDITKFQFLNGAIRIPRRFVTRFKQDDFNSSMVRLE